RAHPQGPGLEPFPAQERVQPDQPPAGAVEAVGLGGETRLGVAVETVGHEEDHGARPEDTAGPGTVELVEAGAEAGAALPVGDLPAAAGERLVGVAVAEEPGHGGEAGGEEEGVDPGPDGKEGMEEDQEHLRVAPHRARDVAEDDEGRRLQDAAAETEG